jgi:hypothetical protein
MECGGLCHPTAIGLRPKLYGAKLARYRKTLNNWLSGTVKLGGLWLGGARVVRYLPRMKTPRDPLYARCHYLAELIGYTVWLDFWFPLSLRAARRWAALTR